MIEPRAFFDRAKDRLVLKAVISNVSGSQSTPQSNYDQSPIAIDELLRIDTGLDVITAIVDSDHRIRVISDLAASPIELSLLPSRVGSYDVHLNYKGLSISPIVGIPIEVPFKSVAIALAILTASASTISKGTKEKGEKAQSASCGEPAGTIGFAADNICSFGTANGVWTFWWPCAGEFKINLDNCCKMHDQKLFCAKNEFERMEADLAFSACVAGELIRRGQKAMRWWCGWLFFPLLVVFAGIGLKTVIDIFFLLYGFTYSGRYLNYDGRNSASCLCGGDKPTFRCNTDPTDPRNYLCHGKTTNCCTRATGRIIKSDNSLPCDYRSGKLKQCGCGRCCWRNGVVEYPTGGDARDCCPNTPGDPSNPIRCSR